ncbi:hypothetical protein DBB30_27005, partial [Yersinia pestis]
AQIAWKKAGFDVQGTALAAKAAQGLQESTTIPSQTLHSLIHQLNDGKKVLNNKTVLVIDEARMVGSRQLAQILDHAEQANTKVILVGDSKQLSSRLMLAQLFVYWQIILAMHHCKIFKDSES